MHVELGGAVLRRDLGFGGSVGFTQPLSTHLQFGIEFSGIWTRYGEDGDRGRYTYRQRLLSPNFVFTYRR